MEPFANVFVRDTHLSVKNMQFSMQLYRTSFQMIWFSYYLWLIVNYYFFFQIWKVYAQD